MAKIVVKQPQSKAENKIEPRAGKMWWIAGAVALLLILIGTMAASMRGGDVPGDRDYGTTRLSDQGAFRVSYDAADGMQINQMHEWTIHVETADGEPVENAVITVDGGMPDHGHGLPTVPQVTDYLGDGNYRVEGLRFQMQGHWIVTFHIDADDVTESVTFDLNL